MAMGAREVLYEETLWAAKDRGEEEFAGSTSFPFSLPILPSLSPTFTEVPKATTTAGLGTGHARGALYSVIAIVNRPLVHEIETAAVVFLRHAAPRQAIDRTPFAVHRGTIAGGMVAYKITAPRVVAASATATFPVVVRLFTAAARGSSPWTATGKTSEWFGATPAWARYLAGKAEARKDLAWLTTDLSPSKRGPVRECVIDGGGRRGGRGAEAVVIVMRDGGVRTDEANGEVHRYDQSRQQSSDGLEDIPVESDDEPPLYSSVAFGDAKERGGGGFGDEEDNDAGTLFEGPAVLARGGGGHGDGRSTSGGDADGDAAWAASVLGVGGGTTAATAVLSGEATLHLGTAGLRGDWCDGEFYLAHYADITLAPAAAEAAAGGRRRWLVPKSEHGETVHVPFRVVYAADGDHAAGWVLPDEWDEWPWRRIEAMEGYKPLWRK
ncbi:hypothetical protein DFJ73DRAFT_796318 [Zopfochytrium polystomum]|nr:hypothetical protein DFJ73DRAFT_796318 [Zopfochytrium polystomum]